MDKTYAKQPRDKTVELIYEGIEFGIESQLHAPLINNSYFK